MPHCRLLMYDRGAMKSCYAFTALMALMAASCNGKDHASPKGCAGTAVVIRLTPSTDGGADAGPACTGGCDDDLEALRVAIEGATQASCVRRPLEPELACAPGGTSPEACLTDTVDAGGALETRIRDSLGASRPDIDAAAVSLDTCVCHID